MMRKKSQYNIAVVGVGAVGKAMLEILKERRFPIGKLRVLARSAREIKVGEEAYQVEAITAESFKGIDIALFAGTEGEKGAALQYAHEATGSGAVVIDNGADFRMDADVPLVVPEVNPKDAKKYRRKGIIANPNCSTIQMVVALKPIYSLSKIKSVVVSTYQAASGAGTRAVDELFVQTKDHLSGAALKCDVFAKQIAFNIIPQIGGFSEEDYTSEEWKMVRETRKIMHDAKMKITATTVRVPVKTGHSEAIYLKTAKPLSLVAVKKALEDFPGVKVVDDVADCHYPLPVNAEGSDDVFVGRVRKDPCDEKGLWLWVVADNLRKGAATNAIQIAELLIRR